VLGYCAGGPEVDHASSIVAYDTIATFQTINKMWPGSHFCGWVKMKTQTHRLGLAGLAVVALDVALLSNPRAFCSQPMPIRAAMLVALIGLVIYQQDCYLSVGTALVVLFVAMLVRTPEPFTVGAPHQMRTDMAVRPGLNKQDKPRAEAMMSYGAGAESPVAEEDAAVAQMMALTPPALLDAAQSNLVPGS
jgi:hypothetical protein